MESESRRDDLMSFLFSLAMDCLRTMGICKSIVRKDEDKCQVARELQKLPSDAVYEILARVELNTLLRQCRWVCKDWLKLIICDAQFQQK
ncbi:hypothetical protein C5167_012126 [Papaver somniferum]|uniref:F-box domain-containing protein n=1 Tax=Papaver somniferum TaxID=3469 RepID=A0A4Y7IZY9_PAPSO|nr:hypothetical protein C5167_012126 [Papaver somniferum]